MTTDESASSHQGDRGGSSLTAAVAVLLGLVVVAGAWWLNRSQGLLVVVVSLDTTRPDHLSAYGYDRETSPTLARLAREGTVFRNARSTSSWTLPSHMSLFTGMPPQLHNVTIDFQTLDTARRTMGQIFQDGGFATQGIYTAPYVHQRYGFGRGMDFYEAATSNPMAFDLSPRQMLAQMHQREVQSHQEVTSPLALLQARNFLNNTRKAKGLLFLHLFDPHYDYRAGPRYRAPFVDPAYDGEITGDLLMAQMDLIEQGDPDDLHQLRALYDAELRYTDDHLAALMQAIRTSDFAERVLLVVTGDHGEEFLENGKFGHRMGLRDEVLRIPMVFWGPGIVPEGQVIDEPVALYDVLPTLVDYAELPEEPELFGRSLRPLIEGGSLPPRPTLSALTFLYADGRDHLTRHESMVVGDLKYVRRMDAPWSPENDRDIYQPSDVSTLEVEIYDLQADPQERVNLLEAAPDDPRIQRAADAFASEMARVTKHHGRLSWSGADDALPGMSSNEALAALGYLEQVGGSLEGILPAATPGTESADGAAAPGNGDG